jgi:hypothetical protein
VRPELVFATRVGLSAIRVDFCFQSGLKCDWSQLLPLERPYVRSELSFATRASLMRPELAFAARVGLSAKLEN